MNEEYFDIDVDLDIDTEVSGEESGGELYEHFRFEVDSGQSPLRLDKYLAINMRNSSRSKIQSAADEGQLLVNGVAQKASYKVRPGDVVTIVMSRPKFTNEIIAEDIPLDIPYEDDDLCWSIKRQVWLSTQGMVTIEVRWSMH